MAKRSRNPATIAPAGRIDILAKGILQTAIKKFDDDQGLGGTLWPVLEKQVGKVCNGLPKKPIEENVLNFVKALMVKTYKPG